MMAYSRIAPPEDEEEEEEEDDSAVIGLDEDVKEIENLLIRPETPKVIGITGTKGLGKTTLIKEVLRRSMLVKEHFYSIFWAEMGSDIEPSDLLKKMLLHLQGNDIKFAVADDIVRELLSKILIEKRCLLVLDNLQTEWSDSFRSALSSVFHPQAQSKIVITTCSAALLASVHHRAHLHQLKCLTNEQKWLLFLSRTDFGGHGIRGKIFKSIGKRCVKDRFIGLPFSILVLAGIFTYDHVYILAAFYATTARLPFSIGLQRKLPSAQSTLFGDKTDEIGIQQVLELSYNAMPIRLRLCLVHMSNHCAEDEGNKISTEELYKVWVDHGIVKGGRRASEQKVVEDCLNDLVKRSLVQVVEKDGESGKIRSCQLNSLVRDFYRTKATTHLDSLLEGLSSFFISGTGS